MWDPCGFSKAWSWSAHYPGGKWVDGLGDCEIGSPRKLLGQQVPKRKWWGKRVDDGFGWVGCVPTSALQPHHAPHLLLRSDSPSPGGKSSLPHCIWATWPSQVPHLQPPGWYYFRFLLSDRSMTWTVHIILDFFSSQARDRQRETKRIR